MLSLLTGMLSLKKPDKIYTIKFLPVKAVKIVFLCRSMIVSGGLFPGFNVGKCEKRLK